VKALAILKTIPRERQLIHRRRRVLASIIIESETILRGAQIATTTVVIETILRGVQIVTNVIA